MQQTWARDPIFKVAYDQLVSGPTNVATIGSLIGDYQGVRDAVKDGMLSMLTGGLSPQAALAKAQKQADASIKAYNTRLGWVEHGMANVAFDHVTKRFDRVVAVRDLTLEIDDHEFLVLLGPSGCGKSTALRMIAGLEEPNEGKITIGDEVVNDIDPKRSRRRHGLPDLRALPAHDGAPQHRVPAEEPRRLARGTRPARERRGGDARAHDLLDRKPAQLSGGQRQRVALARAIVRRPQAFLMDEPLSNLDAKLRVQTRADLIELQQRLETTIVYVTHDQIEAMTMGHRIAVIMDGVLQQVGPPQDVYERPANLFVAGFIGTPPMNTIRARVVRDERRARGRVAGSTASAACAARGPDRRARARIDRCRRAPRAPAAHDRRDRSCNRHGRRVARPRTQHRMPARRRHARHHAPGHRCDRGPKWATPVRLTTDEQHLHVFDPATGDRVGTVVTPTATPLDAEPAPARVLRRRRLKRRTREALLGYVLVLPSLLVFGTFVFYPFVKNIWLGLYRTPPFPGLPTPVGRPRASTATC